MIKALIELERFLKLVAGRVDPDWEARAAARLGFADRRLRAGQQCVVALAGATGSGKSSLVNAISGTRLAAVGARRPTTSTPLAISFSATNTELLDLLGITRRHEAQPPAGLDNLILIDLPDHDSDRADHRAQVDRLVELVDQFVFVVDPQKYADAALHDRYLKRLASHREVIAVTLNQADRLAPSVLDADGRLSAELAPVVEHLKLLLADDGLAGVPVFVTSAATGEGVARLRDHLAMVVSRKRAAQERLAGDLRALLGEVRLPEIERVEPPVEQLLADVGRAAGVDRLAADLQLDFTRRSSLLGAGAEPPQIGGRVASAAEDAQVETALRRFAVAASSGLPEVWGQKVRDDVLAQAETLPARLHTALRDVDLSDLGSPFAWGFGRVAKWLPIVAAVTFAGWLLLPVLTGRPLDLTTLGTAGVAFAAVLAVAVGSSWVLRRGARRAAVRAKKRLQAAADGCVLPVVAAVEEELADYERARSALARMTGILAPD